MTELWDDMVAQAACSGPFSGCPVGVAQVWLMWGSRRIVLLGLLLWAGLQSEASLSKVLHYIPKCRLLPLLIVSLVPPAQ